MTDLNKYTPGKDDDEVIEAEAEIVGHEAPGQNYSYRYYGPRGQSRVFVYRSEGCNCSCCLGCLLFIVLIIIMLGALIFR